MKNMYTIMALDLEHINEICNDIKYQYEIGIANLALFLFKIVPEGNPIIDKVSDLADAYIKFRDRLAEMGLKCGILVQCTIGHGWQLNEPFPFQHLVGLNGKDDQNVVCPFDDDFKDYLKNAFARIAALKPAAIMVDDDFRLMFRDNKGCACKKHMAAFNKGLDNPVTKEELYDIICSNDQKKQEYLPRFLETQRVSLVEAAKAMRQGIDSVDPTIQGLFCTVGPTTEFGAEIVAQLAGEGNPKMVRINNGNYMAVSGKNFSKVSFKIAQQAAILKRQGVDVILAETDTCPQTRYSSSAIGLHAHFTASLLEGAQGAKHWITKLNFYQPESGYAYRNILSKNIKFYDAVQELAPKLKWFGCRIPLPSNPDYCLDKKGLCYLEDKWLINVLERLGFPIYFSGKSGGAAFLDDDAPDFLSDDEIFEILNGQAILSSRAAEKLIKRGFGDLLGVDITETDGTVVSFEQAHTVGKKLNRQVKNKRIVPKDEKVEIISTAIHLKGEEEQPLFPACTLYKNSSGGTVTVFSGSPDFEYNLSTAFGFLNLVRKKMFVDILKRCGNLPVYYPDDAEVYMKAAEMPDGSTLCAIFPIGLDGLEDFCLCTEKMVMGVECLHSDGKFYPLEFEDTEKGIKVFHSASVLEPIILRIVY